MTPEIGNLFADVAPDRTAERIESLVAQHGVTIERIVSTGHASPDGFWYDDSRDEWVALLTGAAALEFDGDPRQHRLDPGDYLHIPAHCRHRVAWTAAEVPTVWLALYFPAGDGREAAVDG